MWIVALLVFGIGGPANAAVNDGLALYTTAAFRNVTAYGDNLDYSEEAIVAGNTTHWPVMACAGVLIDQSDPSLKRAIVIGGIGGGTPFVGLQSDPSSKAFIVPFDSISQTPTPPTEYVDVDAQFTARYNHACAVSADERQLFITGGQAGNGSTLSDTWHCILDSNQTSILQCENVNADLPVDCCIGHQMVEHYGSLYIVGNNDATKRVYTRVIAGGSWVDANNSVPFGLFRASAAVINGFFVVTGGAIDSNKSNINLDTYTWDFSSGSSWKPTPATGVVPDSPTQFGGTLVSYSESSTDCRAGRLFHWDRLYETTVFSDGSVSKFQQVNYTSGGQLHAAKTLLPQFPWPSLVNFRSPGALCRATATTTPSSATTTMPAIIDTASKSKKKSVWWIWLLIALLPIIAVVVVVLNRKLGAREGVTPGEGQPANQLLL